MNHHGNNRREIGQRNQQCPGRYTDWRPNLLHGMSTAVFVGSRTVDSLLPPALVVEKQRQAEPLGTGVTHTGSRGRRRRMKRWHRLLFP